MGLRSSDGTLEFGTLCYLMQRQMLTYHYHSYAVDYSFTYYRYYLLLLVLLLLLLHNTVKNTRIKITTILNASPDSQKARDLNLELVPKVVANTCWWLVVNKDIYSLSNHCRIPT